VQSTKVEMFESNIRDVTKTGQTQKMGAFQHQILFFDTTIMRLLPILLDEKQKPTRLKSDVEMLIEIRLPEQSLAIRESKDG